MDDTVPTSAPDATGASLSSTPAPRGAPALGTIGDEPSVPLPPPVPHEAERLAELLARLQAAGPVTDSP